jgi:DNA (cytosine-5)-methyltransferase 1
LCDVLYIFMIACVDLFSGIGGVSLGLSGLVDTVLYCEWDGYCQSVLSERMAEGKLDPAPIHGDIQTLHLSPKMEGPIMLAGGFPCQDISSMGLQRGVVEGSRSGMFFHILRLIDNTPAVQVLFLENVANILNVGLQEVVAGLSSRGFRMQWILRAANELGAPHVRSRWFCLAIRGDVDMEALLPQDIDIDAWKEQVKAHWAQEPCPRVELKPASDPKWSARCMTLGNAVVPAVVRSAFLDLVALSKNWHVMAECLKAYSTPLSQWTASFPETAIVCNDHIITMPPRPAMLTEGTRHTVDTSYVFNKVTLSPPHWPTPRRMAHASQLTQRSVRDLPTLLVNSKQALEWILAQGIDPEDKPHAVAVVNVSYVEWMMGYVANWTKITQRTLPRTQSRRSESEPDASEDFTPTHDMKPPRKSSCVNGMHILMREHPGKSIPLVACIWRALSLQERARYTEEARKLRT